MPDVLATALATPGLLWLLGAITVAGIVRGFAGFGGGLIFVPVAGIFLSPSVIVAVMILIDVVAAAMLVPRAWAHADRREVGLMTFAAMLTVPAGLWLLTRTDPVLIRWGVAAVSAGMLAALVSGWRFSGPVTRPVVTAVGAMAGITGGLTGLTGPPVILFYLAGQSVARTVRANTILFFAMLNVVIVANLLVQGALDGAVMALALVLAVPYLIASLTGQALFDPHHERLYRWAAYAVIALAVVSGLPVWNTGG